VSAGIDLTLRFIAEVAGEATAGQVQFAAEYVPSDRVYGNIRPDGHFKLPHLWPPQIPPGKDVRIMVAQAALSAL